MSKRTRKIPLRLMPTVAVILLTAFSLVLLHMLFVLDWSEQKPYPCAEERRTPDIYLISYADGSEVFFQNRNMLTASAVNRGFDFIFNYRRDHISPEFAKNNPVLQEKFGAGYWLWKPYFILHTLEQIPEGAILVYLDAGAIIRQPMREFLLDGLASSPHKDVLLFSYINTEHDTTSRIASDDTFVALHCTDEHCYSGHHVWAGFIVLRNSDQSRRFIAQWLHHCQDAELLKGITTHATNPEDFAHHQHDEAILSVLATREADKVIFYPINKPDFTDYIRGHRRRTDETSLLGYISMKNSPLERRILNWWLVRKYRELLKAWDLV